MLPSLVSAPAVDMILWFLWGSSACECEDMPTLGRDLARMRHTCSPAPPSCVAVFGGCWYSAAGSASAWSPCRAPSWGRGTDLQPVLPSPFPAPEQLRWTCVLASGEPMRSPVGQLGPPVSHVCCEGGVGPMKTTPDCDIESVSLSLRNSSVRCHFHAALFVSCSFCEYLREFWWK